MDYAGLVVSNIKYVEKKPIQTNKNRESNHNRLYSTQNLVLLHFCWRHFTGSENKLSIHQPKKKLGSVKIISTR